MDEIGEKEVGDSVVVLAVTAAKKIGLLFQIQCHNVLWSKQGKNILCVYDDVEVVYVGQVYASNSFRVRLVVWSCRNRLLYLMLLLLLLCFGRPLLTGQNGSS